MDKIVRFRLNAGEKYGLGHFSRCFALAQLLKNKLPIIFYIHTENNALIYKLNTENFPIIFIDDENTFFNDIKSSDVVIIDGYDFNEFYLSKVKSLCTKLIVFDDFEASIKNADAIINPFIEAVNSIINNIKYFIGYEHFILRKEFTTPVSVCENRKGTIISLGGTDPYDISSKILSILLNKENFKPIHIVYTGAYSEKQMNYFLFLSSQKLIQAHFMKSANELCMIMDQCQYGIFPSSNILLEGLKRKLNCAFGYYIDNQKYNYHSLLNYKVGIGLENFNETLLKENLNILTQTNVVNIDFVNRLSSKMDDIIDYIISL